MPEPVDEEREEEEQSDKKGVNREFVVFQQSFRLFHDFFLFERFPKNQEKIDKDKGREVNKSLEFIGKGKTKISDKEEDRAHDDTEDQGIYGVLAERSSIVFRFILQQTKLRQPFRYHEEIAKNPPR